LVRHLATLIERQFSEFLGRTELRLSSVLSDKQSQQHAGPLTKSLPLYETESGQVPIFVKLHFGRNVFANF
jgi:hypothetical protein